MILPALTYTVLHRPMYTFFHKGVSVIAKPSVLGKPSSANVAVRAGVSDGRVERVKCAVCGGSARLASSTGLPWLRRNPIDGDRNRAKSVGSAHPGEGIASPDAGNASPGSGNASSGTGSPSPSSGDASPRAGLACPGTGGASTGSGSVSPRAGAVPADAGSAPTRAGRTFPRPGAATASRRHAAAGTGTPCRRFATAAPRTRTPPPPSGHPAHEPAAGRAGCPQYGHV